jgi:hypothetical protein
MDASFDAQALQFGLFSSKNSITVHLNMSEPNNGQTLSRMRDKRLLAPKGSQARYTGEIVLCTRPKI